MVILLSVQRGFMYRAALGFPRGLSLTIPRILVFMTPRKLSAGSGTLIALEKSVS